MVNIITTAWLAACEPDLDSIEDYCRKSLKPYSSHALSLSASFIGACKSKPQPSQKPWCPDIRGCALSSLLLFLLAPCPNGPFNWEFSVNPSFSMAENCQKDEQPYQPVNWGQLSGKLQVGTLWYRFIFGKMFTFAWRENRRKKEWPNFNQKTVLHFLSDELAFIALC